MSIDFGRLWDHVVEQFSCENRSIHGPDHWRRVERNGLLLAPRTGANMDVVRLFAPFHDSRRENDGEDHGHGVRGAALAGSLRGKLYNLPNPLFELLRHACAGHTDGLLHADPTIGTCWDADRLDLGRVGVDPEERYMSTDFGHEIARFGSIDPFLPPGQRH